MGDLVTKRTRPNEKSNLYFSPRRAIPNLPWIIIFMELIKMVENIGHRLVAINAGEIVKTHQSGQMICFCGF